MINLSIGVVLFSKGVAESATIQSLLKIDFSRLGFSVTLLVRDNSRHGVDLNNLIEGFGGSVDVSRDGNNMPLSKVNNFFITKSRNNDILIVFDDDSVLTEAYFEGIVAFYKSGADVATPIIKKSGRMISPGKVFLVKGREIREGEIVVGGENAGLVAMMSGTAIKIKSFIGRGEVFYEKLDFYGVDIRFYLDCKRQLKSIYVVDYCMEHDSFLRSESYDLDEMLSRLSNLMRAHFLIFDFVPLYRVMLFFYFPLFIMSKTISKRDVRFLRLFKNYSLFWDFKDE